MRESEGETVDTDREGASKKLVWLGCITGRSC